MTDRNLTMAFRFLCLWIVVAAFSGCASPMTTAADAHADGGILWVKHAAEYRAVATQIYQQAELALPGFLDDPAWTALPGQTDVEGLRPAIIFDVDDTVIVGANFQLSLDGPFNNTVHDAWNAANPAVAVPGFAGFARKARDAGVELFFLTNRPCEPIDGDPCPQEKTTLDDVAEAGIETDAEHVLLAYEREDWTKEKRVRREFIARNNRVIMVFGDDLGDFIFCARARAAAPCKKDATAASRLELLDRYREYFGAGWYILPNPMYGSWTTVLPTP